MASCATVYQVPGPKGASGSDGTNGTDGENAFTTLAVAFTVPSGEPITPSVSRECDANGIATVIMGVAHNLAIGMIIDVASPNNVAYVINGGVVISTPDGFTFTYDSGGGPEALTPDIDIVVSDIRVEATFTDASWVVIGQFVEIGGPTILPALPYTNGIGTFEVMDVVGNVVTLRNPYDGVTGSYPNNTTPGTLVPIDLRVSPAGPQGLRGVNGITGAPTTSPYWIGAPDALLTGASVVPVAVGYVKSAVGVPTIQAYPIPVIHGGTGGITAAAARTALAAAPAAGKYIVQTLDGELSAEQALSSLATGYVKVTTGTGVLTSQAVPIPVADGGTGGTLPIANGGTGATTAASARASLDVRMGYGLLGTAQNIDLNAAPATETQINIINAGVYIIDKIRMSAATDNMTTAEVALYTATLSGGVNLVAQQAITALVAVTNFLDLTKQTILNTDTRTDQILYFVLKVAQGGASNADLDIYGWKLS